MPRRTCHDLKDTDIAVCAEGLWGNDPEEVLLEAVFLVRQLFYHDREREQPVRSTGIYKEPVAFTHAHAGGNAYGRGTLLQMIELWLVWKYSNMKSPSFLR